MEYFECSQELSQKKLFNLLYAVIMCEGKITSTFVIGLEIIKKLTRKQNCRNSADFVIALPVGKKQEFEKLSGVELKPKQKINLC